MEATKKKSAKRFEQLNRLADDITPTLPTSTHVAVLMLCYRHGRAGGTFRVSTSRLARSARISGRQARRVLDDLEGSGVIELLKEHQGPVPRLYRITGKVANGDTHDPIKILHAPRVNGDTHGS